MKNLLFLLIYLLIPSKLFCQLDFIVDSEYCIEENVLLEAQNNIYSEIFWDFCPNDFSSNINVDYSSTLPGGGRVTAVDFIKYENVWYGFATNTVNNNLLRMTFNEGLNNPPTTIDQISNPNNVLNIPVSIRMVNQNGDVYALIHNWGTDNIAKITFSDGIAGNSFDGDVIISSIGSGSRPEMDLINTSTELKVAVINNSDGTIEIADFRNGIENEIEMSHRVKYSTGISDTRSIEMIKVNNNWHAFISSYSTGKISRVDFGSDLMSGSISVEPEVTSHMYTGNPNKIVITPLGDEFVLHVLTFQGEVYKVNLGTDILNSGINSGAVQYLDSFNFSQGYELSFFKDLGIWHGFILRDVSLLLHHLSFLDDCNVEPLSFSQNTTEVIIPKNAGIFNISLTAYDKDQIIEKVVKSITVTPNTAPTIDFNNLTICQSTPVQFASESNTGGLTYAWDFGDASSSTDHNPSHNYMTPGEYEVTLEVNDGTCDNFIRKTVVIYEEPVAEFTPPTGAVCTNQLVTFANTTEGEFGGNATYRWEVDGNLVSEESDLIDYQFESAGAKEIKLIVSIPGCESESVQNFNITAGPAPNFNVNDACLGTLFDFNNTTTGENITNYSWDFGNGFTSTQENPEGFEYSTSGTFDVQLTATNASGCVTTIEKQTTVYDLPNVNFNSELACEGTPTQLNDLSNVDNANIEIWNWNFDDEQSSVNESMEQNPQHIFETEGVYNVKLSATTTFGCIDSLEQMVAVKPSPKSAFDIDQLCLGEEVQFTDISTPVEGEQITNWAWNLGGAFSADQNPTITFDFPIDYEVSLSVTSENLCTNTTSQLISVNPVPAVTFETERVCSNEPIHFYDNTSQRFNQIVSRNWKIDGTEMASDSSIFVSLETGQHEVELSITTAQSCTYNTMQTIEVNSPSQASFETSVAFGASPLNVQFTNTSNAANTYFWNFDDGSTSTIENPSHIFETEGVFDVTLAIIDANGCSDTTSLIISALIAEFDIALQQFNLVDDKLVLTLINNGTLAPDELSATVNLGDRVILEEIINEPLLPSANPKPINYTLDLSLIGQSVEYVCVSLQAVKEGVVESNGLNNSKCKNFNTSVVFQQPFPNPADDVLNLVIIIEDKAAGSIQMINSNGKTVKQTNFDGVDGRNELALDVSELKGGIYLVKLIIGGSEFITRVAVYN